MMRYGKNLGLLDWETDEIRLLGSGHSKVLKSNDNYLRDIMNHLYIKEETRDP